MKEIKPPKLRVVEEDVPYFIHILVLEVLGIITCTLLMLFY